MNKLTARDLMTADVVTVPPETPVVAMARLLSERGISAVPVMDREGAVLGIVTEADLIRRLAGEEDKPAGWLSSLFADPGEQAERYARTHGASARDVMTEDVVTVTEDTTAAHIAHLMEARNIRRVLVVTEGRLRGLVSRADLLRAILEPSHDVSDQYRDRAIETKDGSVVVGRIVNDAPDFIEVGTNPVGQERERVAKADIAKIEVIPTSTMPKGLLDARTRREVEDLLAYLARGPRGG
jgi:putative heme-binding domain-containing protein